MTVPRRRPAPSRPATKQPSDETASAAVLPTSAMDAGAAPTPSQADAGTAAMPAPKPMPAHKPMTAQQPKTAKTTSARKPSARSAAQSKPKPATARVTASAKKAETADEPGSKRHRRDGEAKKIPWALIAAGGALVLLIIVGLAWHPVRVSMKLNALDACKGTPPSSEQLAEATRLVDEFLVLVDRDENVIRDVIDRDRGPLEAQMLLAKSVRSYKGLLSIGRRERSATTRQQVMSTLVEIWKDDDKDKIRDEQMPGWVTDIARDATQAIAVRTSAMTLLAKIPTTDNLKTLATVARDPASATELVNAALDQMAVIFNSGSMPGGVPIIAGMLNSPIAAVVASNADLRGVMVRKANLSTVDTILPLINSTVPEVRVIALESLGGNSMSLPVGATSQPLRTSLSQQMIKRLDPSVPAGEIAGALKAITQLRLIGTHATVMSRLPDWLATPLPGVDAELFVRMFGQSFFMVEEASDLPMTTEVVNQMSAALGKDALRPIMAKAFALITSSDGRKVDVLLDAALALGSYAQEAECIKALKSLAENVYGRTELSRTLGTDGAKWKAWLEKQNPRQKRIREIIERIQTMDEKVLIVGQKSALYKEAQSFCYKAAEELNTWLSEANPDYPLGTEKGLIEVLRSRCSELAKSIRSVMGTAKD